MREVARIIDGVLSVDGVTAPPREVIVHHHHHHHAPAPVIERPVQQERRTAIAPRIDITVEDVTETMATVVRAAREMDEDDQRQVYRVLHGSLSLVSAMINLDHAPARRAARK